MRFRKKTPVLTIALFLLALFSTKLLAQPENSYQIGNAWYCNNGYKKVGEKCVKIKVPPNAWVQGSQWYCNNGYRRSGEQCIKMDIPENAYAYGSQWYCNIGFKKIGNSCKEMTPAEKQQQIKNLAVQKSIAKNRNIEGFDFSLRDIERKCEAYKYSDSYGDIECSGSGLREVDRRCEAYFSDGQIGEMEYSGSLRRISGDCSINMYSESYGELDCQ